MEYQLWAMLNEGVWHYVGFSLGQFDMDKISKAMATCFGNGDRYIVREIRVVVKPPFDDVKPR